MEGMGTNNMWGFSPALDLTDAYVTASTKASSSPELDSSGSRQVDHKELNILCIGAGDVRHALKTLAQARRHSSVAHINIYLCESSIEALARNLLLLQVATDWEVPIRSRANSFLEIFGNALVQKRTADYVDATAQKLVQFIREGSGSLKRLVDLSALKHRDIDALEEVFHSWEQSSMFDMEEFRDMRLRQFYGQRYDSRNGSIDWDYQVLKKHASIIHAKQFKQWRESGIAFEFGDQTYTESNKTLVSYAQTRERGGRKLRRGYWGDVRVGPFQCFGVDCETPNQQAKGLFKVIGKGGPTEQHRHTTVHIAVYNLLSFLHEIESGEVYKMQVDHDIYSGLGYNERFDNEQAQSKEAGAHDRRLAFAESIADNVMCLKDKVHLKVIRAEDWKATLNKKLSKKKYDLIWVASVCMERVDEELVGCLREGSGMMAVESVKYMLPLSKEQSSQFYSTVQMRTKNTGLVPIETLEEDVDCLFFKLGR